MARKLSRRSQQRITRALAMLEGINTMANSITEEAITDLVRRDAIGIGHDGMPSNSMPEFSSGGGHNGSSTEMVALFGLPGARSENTDDWGRRDEKRAAADVVRKQLQSIENNLRDAFQALKEASFEIGLVQKKTEEVKGRQASTPCEICGVYAAQKAGWCIKDYEEWMIDGRPDRTMYGMWKRQDKNSEGIVLVPNKPKPRSKT